MKALKSTGEIIEVEKIILKGRECYIKTTGEKIGSIYMEEDLDFDIEDKNNPDYWTRLEHQAAIAAMQGMLSNPSIITTRRGIIEDAKDYAQALVGKMKEERK